MNRKSLFRRLLAESTLLFVIIELGLAHPPAFNNLLVIFEVFPLLKFIDSAMEVTLIGSCSPIRNRMQFRYV